MIRLLVTGGRGPVECRMAVARVVAAMEEEADEAGVGLAVALGKDADGNGPASAVVILDGDAAVGFAARWLGTVQWVAKSSVRPTHKRRNWFVGIFRLPEESAQTTVRECDIQWETMRATGPGGQHVTTDSAIRACHTPTGTVVVAREHRSQHRNRAAALERIAAVIVGRAELERMATDRLAWASHEKLERGNPVRVLR